MLWGHTNSNTISDLVTLRSYPIQHAVEGSSFGHTHPLCDYLSSGPKYPGLKNYLMKYLESAFKAYGASF